MSGVRDGALEMHVAGLAVVPTYSAMKGVCACAEGPACQSPAKHPRGGPDAVLEDADAILAHYERHPEDGVAINVARSGLVVIDCDTPAGDMRVVDLLARNNPSTHCEVSTSRGRHLWFRGTAREVGAAEGRGYEVKTKGIVLAPPSVHATGTPYQWARGSHPGRIPDIPQGLVRALQEDGPDATVGEREGVVGLLMASTDPVPNGTRHETMVSLAAHLRATGCGERGITRQLIAVNQSRCDPPLPRREIEDIARWSAGKDPTAGEEDRWQELVPLDPEPVPPMPLGGIPSVVRAHVEAVAEAVQVPADMVLLLDLGALAVACQGIAHVRLSDQHKEQLSLYVMTVLPSGERKSATVAESVKPIKTYEKVWRDRTRLSVSTAQAHMRALEKRQSKAEGVLASSNDDEKRNQAMEDLSAVIREIDEADPGVAPRLLADDTTTEALGVTLHEQGRIGIVSAEGGLFDTLAGRYSEGKENIDLVLKAYDGESVRVDRINRPSLDIDQPHLSMAFSVQPHVIERAARNRAFMERGFIPRFLLAAPQSLLGTRRVDTEDVPRAVRAEWARAIADLLEIAGGFVPFRAPASGKYEIRLSPMALAAWQKFSQDIEPRLNPRTGDLSAISATAGKAAGLAARVAGLLHMAEHGRGGLTKKIDADLMIAAIAIVSTHLQHAARIAHAGADSGTLRDARTIMEWAQSTGARTFSARDALSGARKRAQGPDKMERINPALRLLDERGWIRQAQAHPSQVFGRPASPVFEINPAVTP